MKTNTQKERETRTTCTQGKETDKRDSFGAHVFVGQQTNIGLEKCSAFQRVYSILLMGL